MAREAWPGSRSRFHRYVKIYENLLHRREPATAARSPSGMQREWPVERSVTVSESVFAASRRVGIALMPWPPRKALILGAAPSEMFVFWSSRSFKRREWAAGDVRDRQQSAFYLRDRRLRGNAAGVIFVVLARADVRGLADSNLERGYILTTNKNQPS